MGGKSNAFLVWQQLFKALNVKQNVFYSSSFKIECKMACKKDNSKLKIMAHQKLVT